MWENKLIIRKGLSQGPIRPPHTERFTRCTHRTEHIVVHKAKTYYSDIVNWVIMDKDAGGVWGNPRISFLMPFPSQEG